MKRFSALYRRLDRSTATLDKRAALVDYFRDAPPRDAAWALWLLSGGKIGGAKKKIAGSGELREWIAQESGTPPWLVDDSYDQVGDLAETLALLLDDPDKTQDAPLHVWIEERLLGVAGKDVDTRRALVTGAWHTLDFDQRLAFNKLLTGALRVGVSQRLVQQALAEMSGVDIARIAQRMLGTWTPTPAFLADLLSHDELPGDRQQPYPFFLASPLESALRPLVGDGESTRDAAVASAPVADAVDAEEEPDDADDGSARPDDDALALANDPDAVERALGDIAGWMLEWKWDGIRLQLIRRNGEVALWSRGEERLDGRFPEIEAAAAALPRDCVLDGELLAWREGDAPLAFTALQTRIQRLKPGPKTLADTPVRMQCYDLLELDGEDLRALPLSERRARLESLLAPNIDDAPSAGTTPAARASTHRPAADEAVSGPGSEHAMPFATVGIAGETEGATREGTAGAEVPSQGDVGPYRSGHDQVATSVAATSTLGTDPNAAARTARVDRAAASSARITLSPLIDAPSWRVAAELRAVARERNVEGLMLKRLDSTYQSGRRRGDWWKWKIDPLTIDAVLLYAQSGHGRRSTLYTDYTFGLWDGDALVPVAKAYSGLDDREILQLDKWIRAHTLERFGPVRSVTAHHVFELGFEAVNKSSRHKSGIAVRFPRILRWRRDKPMAEADRLDTLKALAR